MMIFLGNFGIATDAEAAAKISTAGSRAQAAVDRRINLRILPFITDAIKNSAVLRLAAIIAIDRALEGLKISTPHIEIDDDGALYLDPGSRTQQVGLDTDGALAIFP